MKQLTLFLFLALSLSFCKVNEDTASEASLEGDKAKLQAQLNTIMNTAKSVRCTNASEWLISPIGKKACGGPQAYIAYHSSIDTERFLRQVNNYTHAEDAFNKAWSIISDCSITPEPSAVVCQNGEAEFVY